MSSSLHVLHFNDVYRVAPQKLGNTRKTIDVTQFAARLASLRANEPDKFVHPPCAAASAQVTEHCRTLVLFSGDVFSPSVESSVTRGSHMVSLASIDRARVSSASRQVPVMNELAPDVTVVGNHDVDFGVPHLAKLIKDCKFVRRSCAARRRASLSARQCSRGFSAMSPTRTPVACQSRSRSFTSLSVEVCASGL